MPTPVLPPPPQHARISLSDLKAQIVRKLGVDRAQRYFSQLNRLLSQKLSKPEFTKLLLSTIGRENIPLHNQLVRSILRNAFNGKAPPPFVYDKRVPKTEKDAVPTPMPLVHANGDILPSSPRRSRSVVRRVKDHPSPFGPNGRMDGPAHQTPTPADEFIAKEKGELAPCDLKRPLQLDQDGSAEQPVKKQQTGNSVLLDLSTSSRSISELVATENLEDSQCRDHLESVRGPLQAPLGIPCPPSIGGSRRSMAFSRSGDLNRNYERGTLCNSEDLKIWMENIAEGQGLEVTIDSANLLNNALDAYLKRLISSCTELMRSRLMNEPSKQLIYKDQACGKLISDIWQGNYMSVPSGGKDRAINAPISLHDFKVAMELSPQQLGENWTLLLEKLCLYSFEE